MTQCAFPKTLLCESSLLVQAQTITPPAPARWAGFETETLTEEKNLKGLAQMNSQWVEGAMVHTPHRRVILDMDSSESPVHGQQEGAAYNGHFECVCYHPLFLFNQFGDCEAATLRPGNVHSADDWQELLEPVVKGYRKKGLRLLFRGDAAFGKPEVYEYLEQETIGYTIRLSANAVLQREIAHLLVRPTEWPSQKAHRLISRLRLPGPELECFPKSGGQDGVAPGRTVSQNRLHRDQPELSSHRDSPFLQRPRYGGAMDKGRQIRPELDQVVVSTSSWPIRSGWHSSYWLTTWATS